MTNQTNKSSNQALPRWRQSRHIVQRIVIEGKINLLTPARFGGGDKSDQLTEMPLLRDPLENVPLLPGASLAGAMRAYLLEYKTGYEKPEPTRGGTLAQTLFGHVVEGPDVKENEKESRESYLVIEDARARELKTEFRPGVKIDPKTRTAAMDENNRGQLFDMELLEAGTTFPLYVEISLPEDKNLQEQLKKGLAIALTGFERGEIGLGARKRRGFGECKVIEWSVNTYDLTNPQQLTAWLKNAPGETAKGEKIAQLLGVELPASQRNRFCMEAVFKLDGSLLIRSGAGDAKSPDMTHLKSKRNGKDKKILSGTSLAGAIRARALRIARTVVPERADQMVEEMFGPAKIEERANRKKEDRPKSSRAVVRERVVEGRNDLVQTRIRIDRFTGGTYPGALFEQQPVFGGQKSKVQVDVELRNPSDAQIGLLLHLLKDLWTGDLSLGGEASVGRGRLKGIKANLSLFIPGQETPETWMISSTPSGELEIQGEVIKLEDYAKSVRGAK